jgi:hypothetical protein
VLTHPISDPDLPMLRSLDYGQRMATASHGARRLSDDELVEVLALGKKADSIELKLTVPESAHGTTLRALEVDPLEAQIRQVFFFDTPKLVLDSAGLVVRARRIQGKGGDSVVKLRPVDPDNLAAELRASPSVNVEVDAMPGGYVCSASVKAKADAAAVRTAAAGDSPIRKLFTKEQRTFFRDHAPEGLELDRLAVLGPLFVLKVNLTPRELGRRVVGEMWLYPNGARILELSTKCAPGEAFQVAAEARAFLVSRGIDLEGKQQTKTKTALQFFAKQLPAS